jgi:hypothetical protein
MSVQQNTVVARLAVPILIGSFDDGSGIGGIVEPRARRVLKQPIDLGRNLLVDDRRRVVDGGNLAVLDERLGDDDDAGRLRFRHFRCHHVGIGCDQVRHRLGHAARHRAASLFNQLNVAHTHKKNTCQ